MVVVVVGGNLTPSPFPLSCHARLLPQETMAIDGAVPWFYHPQPNLLSKKKQIDR